MIHPFRIVHMSSARTWHKSFHTEKGVLIQLAFQSFNFEFSLSGYQTTFLMIDTHLLVTRSLYSLAFAIRQPLFPFVHGKDHPKRSPAYSIDRYTTLTPSIECGEPSDRQPGPLHKPDRDWLDLYVLVSGCRPTALLFESF